MKEYLQKIFQIIIGIAGILAVLMIVICGIKYIGSGDNSGARSEAKECIWNAIFGILIAVGAWILLNTINPIILIDRLEITTTPGTSGPAGSKGPQTEADPTIAVGVGKYFFKYQKNVNGTPTGDIQNSIWPDSATCLQMQDAYKYKSENTIIKECGLVAPDSPKTPATLLPGGDEAISREQLCGDTICSCKGDWSCKNGIGKVGVNKDACIPFDKRGPCTNVATIPSATLDFIKGLETECNCNVIITGGTDIGNHKSHRLNVAIFDLRYDSASPMTNIIKGTKADPLVSYVSFSGNRRWKHNGYWFTDETSAPTRHWHVCIEGLPDGTKVKYCMDPPATDKGLKFWYP